MQVELSTVKYENSRLTCNAIIGNFSIVGKISFDGKKLFCAGNRIYSGSNARDEAILQAVEKAPAISQYKQWAHRNKRGQQNARHRSRKTFRQGI